MTKNYEKAALVFTESISDEEDDNRGEIVISTDVGIGDETFKTKTQSMNQTLEKLLSIEKRWRWIAEEYGPEKAWVKRMTGGFDNLPVVRLLTKDGDKWCLREVYVVGVE